MIFEEQIGIKLCVTGCVGAIALILTGVISEKDALTFHRFEDDFPVRWNTFPWQQALDQTGAGELIADKVIGLLGEEPVTLCTYFCSVSCCAVYMTNFMSNTATTALMAPICCVNCTGNGSRSKSSTYGMCHWRIMCLRNTDRNAGKHNGCQSRQDYTFIDYAKAGMPLIGIATVVSMILLPICLSILPVRIGVLSHKIKLHIKCNYKKYGGF